MELDGHLKLMALELSCQRLMQRAKLLARAGIIMDFQRLSKVDRMVTESLDALEQEISRAGPSQKPVKKRLSGGSLLRILRGSDETAPVDVVPERSLDTPPSDEHVLSLRGVGDGWPTPDLLGFLGSQRKTGILEVATGAEVFAIEFDAGDIVHAQVNRTLPEQRLGDVLVAKGIIDRDTLENARAGKSKGRLGEILLKGHHVTQKDLLAALETQIQLLFNRLFGARGARFSFWSGPPMHAEEGMRLNAMALILEGARTFDEGNTADGKEPAIDARLEILDEPETEHDTVRMEESPSSEAPAPEEAPDPEPESPRSEDDSSPEDAPASDPEDAPASESPVDESDADRRAAG